MCPTVDIHLGRFGHLYYLICVSSVYSILLDYDFNKLEDIWFTSAPSFTMATMELLMDRLPELLSVGSYCIFKSKKDSLISNLHINSFRAIVGLELER